MSLSRGSISKLIDPSFAKGGSLASAPKVYGDEYHHSGLFKSDVAGRTDRLPHAVPADSFVWPADAVAIAGQSNTAAGAKIIQALTQSASGSKRVRPKAVSKVLVAGGEVLTPPEELEAIGRRLRAGGKSKAKSDLAAGHQWAREMVDKFRKMEIERLKNAPKPKK